MAWDDRVKVIGGDTQRPCGAGAIDGESPVLELADVNGIITWHETGAVFDRWVTLQANGYDDQLYDFRVRDHPVPDSDIPVVALDPSVPPEVDVPRPIDLNVSSYVDGVLTLVWTRGFDYSKEIFRSAIRQPDGQLSNPVQTDIDEYATSHTIGVLANTDYLFSVKGGRHGGSLDYYYSQWTEIPYRTPPRFAFQIHPETKMTPGGKVTSLLSPDGKHIDLFVTGPDGAVWSTFWQQDTGWVPWFVIGTVHMQPGATVAAHWSTATHINLFVTGTDGAVWSTFFDVGGRWIEWFTIHSETKLKPGAPVTAQLSQQGNHIDLFGCTADGTVSSMFWQADTGW